MNTKREQLNDTKVRFKVKDTPGHISAKKGADILIQEATTQRLKVMTYNIHYGIGRDRKYRLDRIISVIKNENPDVVALQEIDKGISRTNFDDQPRIIAEALDMHFHHCVNRYIGNGEFGIATLSRFPIKKKRRHNISFSTRFSVRPVEPRGALFADIFFDSAYLHVFNIHLGLGVRERIYQRRKLLSESVLLDKMLRDPIIVLGDFNDSVISVVNSGIENHFNDAFKLSGGKDGATFRWGPIKLRLDRIYTSDNLRPVESYVVNTRSSRLASDHKPLVAIVETKT